MATKSTRGGGSRMPGPVVIGGVTILAIVIVFALIAMGGGFASPSEPIPTVAVDDPSAAADDITALGAIPVGDLVDCGGMPCPSRGAEDAPVTLIEVSEFSCPHCRDHAMDVAPLIDEEFVDTGQLRIVSHVFANAPTTQYLTSAALCAGEQGKYFEFQREAFEDDLGLRGADIQDGIDEVSARLELDTEAFGACVQEARYLAEIQQSTVDAQRANVLYTPTFIVNGLMIEGGQPMSVFRTKIQQAIEEAG